MQRVIRSIQFVGARLVTGWPFNDPESFRTVTPVATVAKPSESAMYRVANYALRTPPALTSEDAAVLDRLAELSIGGTETLSFEEV